MLITLLIVVLILVACYYVIGLIPDPKLKQIAWVVVVVICIIWLIGRLGGADLLR